MEAGATPNVTTSASESSSLPIGLDTPRSRAVNPSKKSKTAPRTMKSRARGSAPPIAKWIAIQPQMRLQQVMELGICFFTTSEFSDMLWLYGFARRHARVEARSSFSLQHVVATRRSRPLPRTQCGLFCGFPHCTVPPLTSVPTGKRGVQLPAARKSAFPHSETKKTRPYRSEGALWGKSSFSLFIFQMSDHRCVARCALSHDHVNFSVEGKINVYARTELDESQVVV